MILVKHLPANEASPLPGGLKVYGFIDFNEFKEWVQNYVCVGCLVDFKDFTDRDPSTIFDWLEMGCGCEIKIEHDKGDIDWSAKMKLPKEYFERTLHKGVEKQVVRMLEWSDKFPPNDRIRYDHCLAESSIGTYSIEWKSWKQYDSYTVHLDGEFIGNGNDLADAKEIAQKSHVETILKILNSEFLSIPEERYSGTSHQASNEINQEVSTLKEEKDAAERVARYETMVAQDAIDEVKHLRKLLATIKMDTLNEVANLLRSLAETDANMARVWRNGCDDARNAVVTHIETESNNMRMETTAEHIARDMREGIFPKKSERQHVDQDKKGDKL
jgi:hypothetical protein